MSRQAGRAPDSRETILSLSLDRRHFYYYIVIIRTAFWAKQKESTKDISLYCVELALTVNSCKYYASTSNDYTVHILL